MTPLLKLTSFAAVLALLFAGGLALGEVTDPDAPVGEVEDGAHSADEMATSGDDGGEHGAPMPVRGLASAENGLRIVVDDTALVPGRAQELSFRIVDDTGAAVRDFAVEHTKRMHLIVVRRDMTGFQHLHPRMQPDGTWTTSVRLAEAGSYRMFADFVREGEPQTLAADLSVDGASDLRPLPAPGRMAEAGPYTVELTGGGARAGDEAELSFEVSQGGHPVEVDRYLGADGHLVVLREGDLAFLHVHPAEHGDSSGHGDTVEFEATFPSPGRYRMFLQFQADGRVHTAEFTEEVRP